MFDLFFWLSASSRSFIFSSTILIREMSRYAYIYIYIHIYIYIYICILCVYVRLESCSYVRFTQLIVICIYTIYFVEEKRDSFWSFKYLRLLCCALYYRQPTTTVDTAVYEGHLQHLRSSI